MWMLENNPVWSKSKSEIISESAGAFNINIEGGFNAPLPSHQKWWVYNDNGEEIAYAWLSKCDDDCYEASVAVKSTKTASKIGSSALDILSNYVIDSGGERLIATVDNNNINAAEVIKWLIKNGFKSKDTFEDLPSAELLEFLIRYSKKGFNVTFERVFSDK